MHPADQLPHLVKLLEDESRVVQDALVKEFAAFGEDLDTELRGLAAPLTGAQSRRLRDLLANSLERQFESKWPLCFSGKTEAKQLEAAHELLAQYQNGPGYPRRVGTVLDALAEEFGFYHKSRSPFALAQFLFQEKNLRGAQVHYYKPENSNLVRLVETGEGLPITLACTFMLMGSRLGMRIEGCNFPGHFLARFVHKDQLYLVDGFNSGKPFPAEELMRRYPESSATLSAILHLPTSPETIMNRVLRNLERAYQKAGVTQEAELISRLLKTMAERETAHAVTTTATDTIPQSDGGKNRFVPGDLVTHKKYGYRGVVVEYDPLCKADEDWYQSNQTQPSRDQAWYHVLVHGSHQVTYAAESNLNPDTSTKDVMHPLVPYFFLGIQNGRYLRNRQVWPGFK